MGNTRIQLLIDAYTRAFEAREYRNPERLRELVIHQLTEMALNPEVKDAQRIKSLELLGKVAEVGAFMDRKETKVIHESSKIKEKLLDQIKTIINIDAKVIDSDDADELMREIAGSREEFPDDQKHDSTDPTHSPPPNIDTPEGDSPIHINPHIQSDLINTPSEIIDFKEEKNEVETFPPTESQDEGANQVEEGEGVSNFQGELEADSMETPPLQNPGEKG
jgi:hypothetical protein